MFTLYEYFIVTSKLILFADLFNYITVRIFSKWLAHVDKKQIR